MIPDLDEVTVLSDGGKNNPDVLNFPVTDEVDFTLKRLGRDFGEGQQEIIQSWTPNLVWPAFITIDDEPHIGASGMIFYNDIGDTWVCIQTEHLRADAREDHETAWPEKARFDENDIQPPHPGYPIGVFCAGPWRGVPDRPQYRRRTQVSWFNWETMDPWVEGEEPEEPDSEGCAETRRQARIEGYDEGLRHGQSQAAGKADFLAVEWRNKAESLEARGGKGRKKRAAVYRAAAADLRKVLGE